MARNSTIQWVRTNTNFWTFQICKKTVAFITSIGVFNDSFVLNANVLPEFVYHGYKLDATSIEEAKKEVEALFEEALMPIKLQMARDIGEYFGDYVKSDGKFSIDNGEREFVYDNVDELLADWLETVILNHQDAYYVDENGKEWNSWEKEALYIITMVIKELPKGVLPAIKQNSDGWKWFVYDEVGEYIPNRKHPTLLNAGTYDSIIDAIFAQRSLEEKIKSKKYSLDELKSEAAKMRCKVKWKPYGNFSYTLELCGKSVATLYEGGAADGVNIEYQYTSTISPCHWHTNVKLKSSTLEEAQKELEAILLAEYERYLGSLKEAVADYEDRISALKSFKKAVDENDA